MGKTLRIVPFMILLLFLIRCETDYQEFEPETSILALIGQNCDEVFVDRSFDIKDTLDAGDSMSSLSNTRGVSGAEVMIFSSRDTYLFREEAGKLPGHYYMLPIQYPQPSVNDTTLYTLKVNFPWGDTVEGQAFLPTNLLINKFNLKDTLSIAAELKDSNIIYWNKCKHVDKYIILVNMTDRLNRPEHESYLLTTPIVTQDTSCAFFQRRASELIPWVEYNFCYYYELVVFGITAEYEKYLDPRSGGKCNLSSGYGVFTGVPSDSFKFVLTE